MGDITAACYHGCGLTFFALGLSFQTIPNQTANLPLWTEGLKDTWTSETRLLRFLTSVLTRYLLVPVQPTTAVM